MAQIKDVFVGLQSLFEMGAGTIQAVEQRAAALAQQLKVANAKAEADMGIMEAQDELLKKKYTPLALARQVTIVARGDDSKALDDAIKKLDIALDEMDRMGGDAEPELGKDDAEPDDGVSTGA